jgi:hypothetical protein
VPRRVNSNRNNHFGLNAHSGTGFAIPTRRQPEVELANQHTSIEYTLVLALVLVLLAPIAAAEIVAGDRVEDELQAPRSTGAPARVLRDGRRSDLQPSFESAAYRYELLEPPGRGDYSDLDGPTVGRVSDHAFRLPPGIIVRVSRSPFDSTFPGCPMAAICSSR